MYTLGIICHGWHESAAVLVQDGKVIAAVEEERFSRKKFDADFPMQSIRFCLEFAGIEARDLGAVGYGFSPSRKVISKAAHFVRCFPKSIDLFTHRVSLLGRMRGIQSEIKSKLGFPSCSAHRARKLPKSSSRKSISMFTPFSSFCATLTFAIVISPFIDAVIVTDSFIKRLPRIVISPTA